MGQRETELQDKGFSFWLLQVHGSLRDSVDPW